MVIDTKIKRKAERNVYRELQQSLDNSPISFPATESGVELRILKHLFTPENALIASKLSFNPKALKDISSELEKDDIPLERVEKGLDELLGKGLIKFAQREKDGEVTKYYSNSPLVIGFYEFQLNNLTEDFVRDVDQYFEEGFMEEVNKTKIPQLRTIPVEQAVGIERNIMTYDDLRTIIENAGDLIVLNECICRKKHDLLGDHCKRTELRETCFSFRTLAKAYLGLGLGRKVSKEEALEVLESAEKAGLVLQPGNSLRPMGMCCCCGCCCDIMVNQKKFDAPAELFATNYHAEVDIDTCVGCGTCETRCNMDAIKLIDGVSTVDLTRCVGCGICTPTCPEEAITLVKKQQEVTPPKNSLETYKFIAQERARLRELESNC